MPFLKIQIIIVFGHMHENHNQKGHPTWMVFLHVIHADLLLFSRKAGYNKLKVKKGQMEATKNGHQSND